MKIYVTYVTIEFYHELTSTGYAQIMRYLEHYYVQQHQMLKTSI